MKTLHECHMAMIDAVNTAVNVDEHYDALSRLYGWCQGVRDCGREPDLFAADLEQMEIRGINRPMCCGVFNDWTPSPQEPV